jgi:hypothetical protein
MQRQFLKLIEVFLGRVKQSDPYKDTAKRRFTVSALQSLDFE